MFVKLQTSRRFVSSSIDRTRDMVRYPVDPRRISTHSNIYDYEILETFFRNHDIVPVWMNSHYSWGWYDEEAGKWTGAVGKVRASRAGGMYHVWRLELQTIHRFSQSRKRPLM